MKGFKKNSDDAVNLSSNDLNLDVSNIAIAREFIRKMHTTTSYSKNFGDKPKT